MYVLKNTLNALWMAHITTQGQNHTKSHEAHDAHQFCKSPILLGSRDIKTIIYELFQIMNFGSLILRGF
jgi:hypothetical protein